MANGIIENSNYMLPINEFQPLIPIQPYPHLIQQPQIMPTYNQILQRQQFIPIQHQQQQQIAMQQIMVQQEYQNLIKLFIDYDLSPEELYEKNIHITKLHFYDAIENLAYGNNSLIFGNYISNKIYLEEIYRKFFDYIAKHENIKNFKFQDNLKELLFYNTSKYFKPYNNRLNISNKIEIMIHNENYNSFYINLNYYLNNNNFSYDIKYLGDLTTLSYAENITIEKEQIYLIIYKIKSKLLNIEIDIFIYVYNLPTNINLLIPYGLYNSENLYITLNKKNIYELQHSKSNLDDVLYNIKHKRITIMGFVECNKINKIIKNQYKRFDFMIGDNLKSFFWLKNLNNEKPKQCSKCNLNIENQYLKLKCCKTIYHPNCLIEEIIYNGDTKCTKCNIMWSDPYKKCLDILMGLSGFYE